MGSIKLGTTEVNEQALQFKFHLSSGPGGQNVNKVATAVELRFDVVESGLSDSHAKRVVKAGQSYLNSDGQLVIHASRHRSQKRNKEEALQRLIDILESARVPQKPRIPTRPTAQAKALRLDQKRKTSKKKRARKSSLHENS